MPNLMVVGQQEFISTVEKPHSKKLNAFVHKYMKFHVLNLFRQVSRRSACELHFLPFFCRSFRFTMNLNLPVPQKACYNQDTSGPDNAVAAALLAGWEIGYCLSLHSMKANFSMCGGGRGTLSRTLSASISFPHRRKMSA